MVDKIRVIVASQPRLMREVVLEMVSDQPDIEVVAELQDVSKVVDAVSETHADWVVIALDELDNRPDICGPLFQQYPNLKILAIASERNKCVLYWATVSVRSSRVESSERGILDALRGRLPVSSTALFPAQGGKRVN